MVWHLDSPSFHLLFPRKEWIWVSLEERTEKAPPDPFISPFLLLAGVPPESICLALPLSCGKRTFPARMSSNFTESRWVGLGGRLFAENGCKYSLPCSSYNLQDKKSLWGKARGPLGVGRVGGWGRGEGIHKLSGQHLSILNSFTSLPL